MFEFSPSVSPFSLANKVADPSSESDTTCRSSSSNLQSFCFIEFTTSGTGVDSTTIASFDINFIVHFSYKRCFLSFCFFRL
uniref:Secreted protein n=1 Tax=Ascaris lumbricoides TaxID=6252 RepID=A0A0M3HIV1_ASCLU